MIRYQHLTAVILMLSFGAAGVYAHEKPVKMTFSGTEAASAIDLQVPGTHTGEFNFAGDGTLGSFTFRNVEANGASQPQPTTACPANQVYAPTAAGVGVFRFKDGSLLKVKLTEGHDCIDFVALEAHCIRTFQVTGGTGRFKNVSGGILTLKETAVPVLNNAAGLPVFFSAEGEFTGTVSGLAMAEEGEDK